MVIRTFDDVTMELRRVKDELDRIRSQNYDLNGRRVINAGRAVKGSDYITKDEVLELLVSSPEIQKIEPGFLQVDFVIVTPVIGDDPSVRPVPFIPFNEKAIPILCGARLKTPPSGGSFSLRWNHFSKVDDNTVDLFDGSLLTIAAGESYSTVTSFYPNRNVATQDYFTIDVTAVNGATGLYTFLALMVK